MRKHEVVTSTCMCTVPNKVQPQLFTLQLSKHLDYPNAWTWCIHKLMSQLININRSKSDGKVPNRQERSQLSLHMAEHLCTFQSIEGNWKYS